MSGLEQEYSGKVRAFNVDATTPDANAACTELGFGSHGLVIRSADGEVLWSQKDHEVNMDDARAQIAKLIR